MVMKTLFYLFPFALTIASCSPKEVSFEALTAARDKHCNCLRELPTMDEFDSACKEEEKAVDTESELVDEQIDAHRESNREYFVELEQKRLQLYEDYLVCKLDAAREINKRHCD